MQIHSQDTPATVWYTYVCTYCTSISNGHSPSVTSPEDVRGVGVGVLVAVDVEVTAVSVSIENNTIK